LKCFKNCFIGCFSFVSANYHKPPCTYYDMMINKMNPTKIAIALVALAALTLVVVGLASAQIAADQTYTGSTPSIAAPNGGFLGWLGSCFGLRNNQPNYGNPYIAPQLPTNSSVPAPYQSNQGNIEYGYGSCWAR
jgi:hypothetical protein